MSGFGCGRVLYKVGTNSHICNLRDLESVGLVVLICGILADIYTLTTSRLEFHRKRVRWGHTPFLVKNCQEYRHVEGSQTLPHSRSSSP